MVQDSEDTTGRPTGNDDNIHGKKQSGKPRKRRRAIDSIGGSFIRQPRDPFVRKRGGKANRVGGRKT